MYLEENLYTKVPLRFNKDGKFKILMFSDTHGHNQATLDAIDAVVEIRTLTLYSLAEIPFIT